MERVICGCGVVSVGVVWFFCACGLGFSEGWQVGGSRIWWV